MKTYIKQIDPELQNFDYFSHYIKEDDGLNKDIIIKNNSYFIDYIPEELKDIINNLYDFNYDVANNNSNLKENANYYFKKNNGKHWSSKELHEWRNVYNLLKEGKPDEAIIKALTIKTGKNWRLVCICGMMQSEWNKAYISEDISEKQLLFIECCYFNTGIEWIVYESKKNFEDDIDGYTIYLEDNKKENIAEYLGIKSEELVIMEFAGYKKIPQYKEME